MSTAIGHFWLRGTDGRLTLYEADYCGYPVRDGVMCYSMIPHSERPCSCQERECHERRLAAILG